MPLRMHGRADLSYSDVRGFPDYHAAVSFPILIWAATGAWLYSAVPRSGAQMVTAMAPSRFDAREASDKTCSGLEMFSLAGKTALVTGASRGIGRGIAVAFAAAGADVALAARSASELEAAAAHIRSLGRNAVAIPCDVTSRDQVTACVDKALADLGTIDVLVNNAGGPRFNAAFLDIREEGWHKVIELNLTSVMRFCQRVGAHMVERRRGSVINIASVVTFRSSPAVTSYGAAKAAVVNLTQGLAQEWAHTGVRVNAVSPGWIATEINRALIESDARESVIQDVPLGRWGESDDVTGVAVWLASDASSYVTGTNIPVDGGLSVSTSKDWHALRAGRT